MAIRKAKAALSNYQPSYVAIELDVNERGDAIQYTLHKISGIRTVPQVFINGKFLGGGDDTVAAHHSGKLASLL
uniref:Glutaredoxin domain-containing protein n=1 Tax=Steinernema glaseri TaxID=37863 RepID=A0A1I7Z288_9BILA